MRIYGRVLVDPSRPKGPKRWVVVETTANGLNDGVYITALAQTLKLNLNESPFWANFGIPAHQSVMQQIWPDFYITFTQQYYNQFFASLIINPVRADPEPHYTANVVTHQGFKYPNIRINGAPT